MIEFITQNMMYFLLIVGFALIIFSSNVLIDAASSIALKLKVPKILVALTIVSFGTSAPEMAISLQSVQSLNGEMAFSNIIGSTVVNACLILGIASFLKPIRVKHQTIKKELPIILLITFGFAILMLDSLFNPLTPNAFSRADGIILLLLFSIFVLYLVQMLFRRGNVEEEAHIKYPPVLAIILLIVSLFLISFSSDLIVQNAEKIAFSLGISKKIITMVVIVVGTSLPELVMTILSTKKGEFDLAIGNIVGTNIFNICVVLGLPVAIYGDILLTGFGIVDILAVVASSTLLFFFARSERVITKKEGIVLLLTFLIYYIYIWF